MGNAPSTWFGGGGLSDEQIEALKKETKLGENQLKAAHKGFKKGSAKGMMNKEEFMECLQHGGIKSAILGLQFWRVVNPSGSDNITFVEFAQALSLIQRGEPERRLDMTVRLLDVDNDGAISRQDLLTVVQEVHALCGQLVSYSGRIFSSPQEFVDTFFSHFHCEPNASLSRQQFVEGSYKSLDMISTLGLFGGTAMPLHQEPSSQSSSQSSSSSSGFIGPQMLIA